MGDVEGGSDTRGGSAPSERPRKRTIKILAPDPRRAIVARPHLERRLDEALEHRLTLVVANAGFGKSSLLSTWASSVRSGWYTVTSEDAALRTFARGIVDALRPRVPGLSAELTAAVSGLQGPDASADEIARADAFAALLCDSLEARLRRDLFLVLDDVHEIDNAPAARRLFEAMCRQAPPLLHLVAASRRELPFPIERLRGAGHVLEIGGSDLAFGREEVAALISSVLGDAAATELSDKLQEVTGGWPVALRLAIEGLRHMAAGERARVLERLRQPGGRLYEYLATEVFAHEPDEVSAFVRTVAPLRTFTPDLCAALGINDAAEFTASLARRGLFLEVHQDPIGWYSLSALVREFASVHLPLPQQELREVRLRAAAWHEEHGHAEAALGALDGADDHENIARVLLAHGRKLLRRGNADTILGVAGKLPSALRDAHMEQLIGEAQHMRGDWDAALGSFLRAGSGSQHLGAALAWRMGMIHHWRGELDQALEIYGRGVVDGSAPAEEAILLAWTASAHWLRAERESCLEKGRQSFELATVSGDSRALAAAHTVLALIAALEGDRSANDAHYVRALAHAEEAGDVLQRIRIHVNRGSRHTEEGDYPEALDELEMAIRLADLAGYRSWRALALSNRGEVKLHLGLLDEAIANLEEAKALYQRIGSRMVAYPLAQLGTVYRERGDLALARAAYEEAIVQAEEAQDVQGLVPALAGLARVLSGHDPEQAAQVAERAVAYGPGMGYVQALLARGWVALAHGRHEHAARDGEQAEAAARGRRDRAGLAEALELEAAGVADRDVAARLDEARSIWRDLRNPLAEARTELALAHVSEGTEARRLAERAGRRLRELGARPLAAAAADLLAELDRESRAPVEIRTLGGFEVLRDGEPVPLAEWQSKKARDLLKMLVARRGQPIPRDALMEDLWPGQDRDALGGRLSVALATVRSVLDPEKRLDREALIMADKGIVKLAVENISVDMERFLGEATAGLALRRKGQPGASAERLARAEAMYSGDFLAEDPYEDWAVSLREEARAAYIDVARSLAEDALAAGEDAGATKYFLRILERDHYDERAHLGLVSAVAAAERHGEAHRFYRAYCERMDQIGVEAAPFPGRAASGSP